MAAPLRSAFTDRAAEIPHRTSSGLIWLVAAGALVTGIVLGFFSGYRAAERGTVPSAVAEILDPGPAPTPPESSPAGSSQTFSEATVTDAGVVRVDPEPVIVPDEPPPAPAPVVPAPRPARPEPRPPAVAPVSTAPGSIEVLSRPSGAQVILDGRIVGRTPLSIPNVAPGSHSVRLELPTFNRWATDVEVSPGARARVAASLEQP